MDLVIYIFRNSMQEGGSSLSSPLSVAKDHLRYVFSRNPVVTRRLACHAASIVGIARECTIHTPCETIRVFMGFAYLLAFTKFFPFQLHEMDNHLGDDEDPGPQLDLLPWKRSPDATGHVERWIECGGRASLEFVGNICDVRNFEALKQTGLKALQDLRVWGLAGKFYRSMRNFY